MNRHIESCFAGAVGAIAPNLLRLAISLTSSQEPKFPGWDVILTYMAGLLLFAILGIIVVIFYRESNLQKAFMLGISIPAIIQASLAQIAVSAESDSYRAQTLNVSNIQTELSNYTHSFVSDVHATSNVYSQIINQSEPSNSRISRIILKINKKQLPKEINPIFNICFLPPDFVPNDKQFLCSEEKIINDIIIPIPDETDRFYIQNGEYKSNILTIDATKNDSIFVDIIIVKNIWRGFSQAIGLSGVKKYKIILEESVHSVKPFCPICLNLDPSSNIIYTLNSKDNIIYKSYFDNGRIEQFKQLIKFYNYTDQCLIKRNNENILVGTAYNRLSDHNYGITISYVSTQLCTNTKLIDFLNDSYFVSIAYHAQNDKLYLTNPIKNRISTMLVNDLLNNTFRITELSIPQLESPRSIYIFNEILYVSDIVHQKVFALNLIDNTVETIIQNISSVTCITANYNNTKLLILDEKSKNIYQLNLSDDIVTSFKMPDKDKLISPTGIIEDRDGNFWISDQGTQSIFKFSHEGKILTEKHL